MKRNLHLVVVAIIAMLLQGHSMAPAHTPLSSSTIIDQPKDQALVSYGWYYDQWFSDPTGTSSDLSTELTRLRNNHPGYTFSGTAAPSLHEYEYGYAAGFPTCIIYSDY